MNNSPDELVIDDCYAACKGPNDTVFIYVYAINKLVQFNILDYKYTIHDTPKAVEGPSAITHHGKNVIFYGTYESDYLLQQWNLEEKRLTSIGSYPSMLRGLSNEKFITFGNIGFTIVDHSS